ncbi:hypothetical protein BDV93DRAFT_588378 [Ceratobasidium sp. AG-I]|nr:hypothetical protein BDV93DRAFT_588378 [Ceratobasidium sp. AG-I]
MDTHNLPDEILLPVAHYLGLLLVKPTCLSLAVHVFARFLAGHPLLQTVILYSARSYTDIRPLRSFSLVPYPDALPNLKVIRAPVCIIAGIVKSKSAVSSLVEVSNWIFTHAWFPDLREQVKRIISSFEGVSNPPLRRLKIQVPQLKLDLFMRLSKCMPNLGVLELDEAPTNEEEEIHELSLLSEEISAKMYHITDQEVLLMVGRDSTGAFKSAGGIGYLNDVDVVATVLPFGYGADCMTRPRSKKAEELYKSTPVYMTSYANLQYLGVTLKLRKSGESLENAQPANEFQALKNTET